MTNSRREFESRTLIIWHCAYRPDYGCVATQKRFPRDSACSGEPCGSGLRRGLFGFSLSRCFQPAAVRLGYGAVLLRRGAEEWQDGIFLRPATASNVRSRAIFTRWLCSLLASQPASRATNRHLVSLSGTKLKCLRCHFPAVCPIGVLSCTTILAVVVRS